MKIETQFSLKPYNTFGFESIAQYWAAFTEGADLYNLFSSEAWQATPKYLLSGGSNVLLNPEVKGLVLHSAIKGIEVVDESDQWVLVKVGGGEDWDTFVAHTLNKGWYGLENLSYIPGMVGTSPIQNIGAYGAEVKDTLERVAYFDTQTLTEETISNKACQFGYRDSIFKHALKGRAIITHVYFRLSKKGAVQMGYGHLHDAVHALGEPTPERVREAVISIRRQKLPEPEELGSAGSFFKNPYVGKDQLDKLLITYPQMPHYALGANRFKIPAGWLIDQCGWKGFREGDAGVHKQQALVLVNYGKATRTEILDLAEKIEHSVKQTFGIGLHREVNLLP
ncbi:MAG: UDP-N-acetylmuramate dehydrogenase [Bacteroidales bacterium]